jgi:transposase-like protein
MPTPGKHRLPPHCPNPDCDSHRDPHAWRFKKKGFYLRRCVPRRVQRYLCHHCHRHFSSQTFSTTYWLRRPDLLRPLFWRLVGCSGYRQIAREFDASHATIQHQAERLGRHCLLLHERLRPRAGSTEPLVLDGFRTFESGQYWPFDLNLLVGVSHYVYGFNDAELRRSGTMRPSQRVKRASLEARFGRAVPQATEEAVAELVGRIVPEGTMATIRSDEHPGYPTAISRLSGRAIDHETTSSKESRTARNPLFAANLADLLLRHASANHKRETIAFSKRRQGALYRAAVWMVWRNYVKWSSEKRRDPPPGVAVGAIGKGWTVENVLAQRELPWRGELSGWLEQCYFGRIPTRRLPGARTHRRTYAD